MSDNSRDQVLIGCLAEYVLENEQCNYRKAAQVLAQYILTGNVADSYARQNVPCIPVKNRL